MTAPVNLYNIYLGNFSDPISEEMKDLMDYVAENIGGTDWFKIKTAYYQINANGTKTYESDQANFIKRVEVQTDVQNGTLTDTAVIDLLISLFNSKELPVDANGIYNVIFRGDYNYNGWLLQWCGYHYGFYLSNGVAIKFTAVGDTGTLSDTAAPLAYKCQAISDGIRFLFVLTFIIITILIIIIIIINSGVDLCTEGALNLTYISPLADAAIC